MKPSYKIHWYSETAQKPIPCEGPNYYEKSHQIHWPHTILFIFEDKQFLYLSWNLSVFMMTKS